MWPELAALVVVSLWRSDGFWLPHRRPSGCGRGREGSRGRGLLKGAEEERRSHRSGSGQDRGMVSVGGGAAAVGAGGSLVVSGGTH